jgi:hypothetical protein
MDPNEYKECLESKCKGDRFHYLAREMLLELGFNSVKIWFDASFGRHNSMKFASSDNVIEYATKNNTDRIRMSEGFNKLMPRNQVVVVSTVYGSVDKFIKKDSRLRFISSKSLLGLDNKVVDYIDLVKASSTDGKDALRSALDTGYIVKHNGFYFMHPMLLYHLVLKKKK